MLPTSISMAKNFLMMIQGDVHSFRGEVLRLLRPLQVLAWSPAIFDVWICGFLENFEY